MRLEGPVDLAATLLGGQAFRWTREEGGAFTSTLDGRFVRLRALHGGAVEATATPRAGRALFERYLRLEPADAARRTRLEEDPVLAPALKAAPGLRLLRQDPWETTVAFLTSANNNVLRIEGILQRLAKLYGEPVDGVDEARAFPSPERVARVDEASLRGIGLGYRAPYLQRTAQLVARGDVDLASLRGASWAEARASLMRLPGVGPKVADCVALFSLDVDDAFPVDRWISRIVSQAFFDGRALKSDAVIAFALERWGEDAGLAQQYLFHLVRMDAGAPGTGRF